MKNRFRSKAPPGGMARVVSSRDCLHSLWVLVALLCFPSLLAAQIEQPPDLLDRPDYTLEILAKIQPKDHPGFGCWTAPLGDINNDGYDDFAVSTLADTTFIFLGGDPLDHEADFFVLGGAMGICSGDFNGDSLVDLVTARGHLSPPDAESRGAIRIYLNTGDPSPYQAEPDRIMVGEIKEAMLGYAKSDFHSGVHTADMNGDGISDLLYYSNIRGDPVAKGRQNLILGGPDFIDRTPQQFLAHPRGANAHFAEMYMSGDLNGDGCDELVIFGDDLDTVALERTYQMSVYLGNTLGVFDAPDIVNRSDSAWVVERYHSNICDVNGDGCGDIVNALTTVVFGAVHLFRSSPTLTLHRSIWLNDSIPNQYPISYVEPGHVSPVGDMNGDGYDDFIIGFYTKLEPNGLVYLLYPAGPNHDWKTATGAVGILSNRDALLPGAYPAGDVNGDGFDEIILVGRPNDLRSNHPSQRVWLYRGSPRLRTGIETPSAPSIGALEVWPQPLRAGKSLNVRLPDNVSVGGTLKLHDLLGRTLRSQRLEHNSSAITGTISTNGLTPGAYLLRFESALQPPRSRMITLF